MRIDGWRIFGFLLGLLLGQNALAIDFNFESMLSPGPLSNPHTKFEGECKKCHGEGRNKSEVQLCMNCHEPVAKDIKVHTGYHGRSPGVAGSECRFCHSEHQGRTADILQMNAATFQHLNTDFQLEGHHKDVPCTQCHQNGKPFREAPQQCVSCHQKDDVHKGSQGKECSQCHNASRWGQTTFSHDKTAFPLLDKHRNVTCTQCHRSSDFKGADKQCTSCHKIDDVHLGRFGQQCNDCHDSKGWKQTRFNHTLDTRFELQGSHASLTCAACHGDKISAAKAPTTCNGCHQQDDVHKARNGTDCQQCHNQNQWKTTRFDHGKTGFILNGAHQSAVCEQCHANDVKTPIKDKTCNGCHARQDAHQRALGTRCDQCHNEKSWRQDIRFDHDLSAFPLLGAHATVGCEACHANSHFRGTPQACQQCHQNDPHKHAFGKQCDSCHHPIGWEQWVFDHDKTHFALEGKHKGVQCEACHKDGSKDASSLSTQCGSCHMADDTHRGAYGAQCDTCHDTQDFSDIHMR